VEFPARYISKLIEALQAAEEQYEEEMKETETPKIYNQTQNPLMIMDGAQSPRMILSQEEF